MARARPRLALPNWAVFVIYAVALGLLVFRDGFDAWSGISMGLFILFGVGFHHAAKVRRPLGSYLVFGIASMALGFLFIGTPLMEGGSALFGAISWAIITGLVLIWLVHYEHTEPR